MCRCRCENKIIVLGASLKNGNTKSCGCLKLKHGQAGNGKVSKVYGVWHNMMQRCGSKNNAQYNDYGGRGIKVCYRWSTKNKKGFQNFIDDMGKPPTNKHQIDRINNNRGYYKLNCHWVLSKENNRNRRSNRFLKMNGIKKCISEWSELIGIKKGTILMRLKRKWSTRKTLTTPVRKSKNRK